MNVDQSNTSVHNIEQKDQKTTTTGALASPSPLAPATATRGNSQEQPTAALAVPDMGNSGSAVATPAAVQKKEGGGLTKVQADKKKIDARKKSLKRL